MLDPGFAILEFVTHLFFTLRWMEGWIKVGKVQCVKLKNTLLNDTLKSPWQAEYINTDNY